MWTIADKIRLKKHRMQEIMYNIADFPVIQLILSRFTLIESAQSSHVCLNFIIAAQFYQSDKSEYQYQQTTNVDRPNFFPAEIWLNISGGIFDSRIFFGRFSADKNSAANPAISYGWGSSQGLFHPWRHRLLNGPVCHRQVQRTLLWRSTCTPMHCACTW